MGWKRTRCEFRSAKRTTPFREMRRKNLSIALALMSIKMQEIAAALPSLSTTDTAVLAAVNIADELLRLRDEQNGMHSRLAQILEEQQQSEVQAAKEDLLPKLPETEKA